MRCEFTREELLALKEVVEAVSEKALDENLKIPVRSIELLQKINARLKEAEFY